MAVRSSARLVVLGGLILACSGMARAEKGPGVSGRVVMPDACSPAISPAVVTLKPLERSATPPTSTRPNPARATALVNQNGLQFEPRVQIAKLGETIRFTNQDGETHNVHILTPGFPFSKTMAPGVPADFVPTRTGVIRLACDIHSHMRGFVVVTDSPWSTECRSGGDFRFRDVPDGQYTLTAWHEMGPALTRPVTVQGGAADLGVLTLESTPVVATAAARTPNPVRAWPEVVDRIGVLLAEARQLVRTPEGVAQARRLAEDAYFSEFELSDMETAVRSYLGFRRSGAIEGQFHRYRATLRTVAEGQAPPATLVDQSRQLLLDLTHAADDLRKIHKVTDRTSLATTAPATTPVEAAAIAATDVVAAQKMFAASLDEIRRLADAGKTSDASSAVLDAYFQGFEPLERILVSRRPQDVKPLEARFVTIRGRIDAGLKGEPLGDELRSLRTEVAEAMTRSDSVSVGSFSAAFVPSVVTILREGVEVILLLAMLIALVRKTDQAGAMTAIRWGIGLAVVASALTALGLNFMVSSSQGRTREILEGVVMLVATGVLFSVSYWLISQTQAKKWANFLRQRTVGVATGAGGLGTLCLTAFLAVYREGAETALMYQAMISAQAGSRPGYLGLAAGLVLGLVALGVVVLAVRRTSARVPLRPFFQFTGYGLFAMAVVFAGNGVFELQNVGVLKVTPLAWIDWSLPVLGIYPNVQSLSVQGLLLVGAAVAWLLPWFEGRGGSDPAVNRRATTTPASSPVQVGV